MKWAVVFPLVLVLGTGRNAFSQEYSYAHYDITEGLAGTMAYCIAQDADGFIWVGTETGVSRFDGTHFKNFTTADGLPDIEVLQIFGDSKGRVWMAPFKKSVCYYYRGKIYHPGNDSMLSQVKLKGNIEGFAEDARGNVLIEERAGLHLVFADGRVRNIDSINGSPILECMAVCRSSNGDFLVQEGSNIWNFSDSFTFFRPLSFIFYHPNFIAMDASGVVLRQGYNQSYYMSFSSGKNIFRPADSLHYRHISFSLLNDGYVYYNEFWGATQIDPVTGRQRLFLPGVQVSRTYRDKDGNLWFTSLNQGIYRLNSTEIQTRTIGSAGESQSVTAMTRIGDTIWAGTDHNLIFKLTVPGLKVVHTKYSLPEAKEKVTFIDSLGDGIIYCTGYGVLTATRQLKFTGNDGVPVKWVIRLNADSLLIGSAAGVMIYSIRVSWITDTLWRERSTAGFVKKDTIYFGTMGGLYRVTPEKLVVYLGKKIPFLTKRISAVTEAADGTLWVASYDAGIVGIRNDTESVAITTRQGLTSDICRTLLVKGQVLWVGTDKGLNAIRLDSPGYPITRYTSHDGLASNMIDMLFVDDSVLYVSTSAGLSYFNYNKNQIGEPCRLRLLGLVNSGKDRIADTGDLLLSYKSKDIRFEYVGISYRSVGNIRYRYRMLGLDSSWRETNETFLDYPSLPSGEYLFQLQATNKFGVASAMLSLPFRVETPYWEATWFRALVVACIFLLTWLLVRWRIRYIRRQQNEREELVKQRAEMENKALQAQMNPHFIFNCLNSIQQFFFEGDEIAVNNYISGFSRLIRATLHNSSRDFISVADEADYLSTYLSLEKMRFKDKMDYLIEVDPAIDQEKSMLPPMLIQPYVENCMRHGLRHKVGGRGFIHITIGKVDGRLVVMVEDNGIGRKKAMEIKTREHIEYQSRGMTMTADRLKVINAIYGGEIVIKVEDVMNEDGKPAGTRIVMNLPEFTHWTADER